MVKTSSSLGQTGAGPREPKYWSLRQHLLDLLETLPPDAAIPTERALAAEFRFSRTTVRQAIADLTAEGRLRRVQGKGTFAAEPKIAQRLQLSSYTEDIRAQGREPSSKLLEIQEIHAEPKLAKLLATRTGAKVWRLRRLRFADAEPMALETTHLPMARFRGLAKHIQRETTEVSVASLYAVLHEHYGVDMTRAEETIETALAGPREADLLGADVGMPILLLSRHSFDRNGKPVEYARSIYRGDRYTFVTTLSRP